MPAVSVEQSRSSLDKACGSLVTKNRNPLVGVTQNARQPQTALAVLVFDLGVYLETLAQLALSLKIHVAGVYSFSNLSRPSQDLLLLGLAQYFAFYSH